MSESHLIKALDEFIENSTAQSLCKDDRCSEYLRNQIKIAFLAGYIECLLLQRTEEQNHADH